MAKNTTAAPAPLAAGGINKGWRPFTRQIVIAFSYANLCFLQVWLGLLSQGAEKEYVLKRPPAPTAYLACLINVCTLALAAFALIRMARRVPRRYLALLRCGAILSLLVPLNSIRNVLSSGVLPRLNTSIRSVMGNPWFWLVVVVLAACAIRFSFQFTTVATYILIIVAPLLPFCIMRSALRVVQYAPSLFADKKLQPPLPAKPAGSPRILWVIFDEWDQRLTFDDRPKSLALPEIDRFQSVSLFASHAYPPNRDTLSSIPALMTGRLLAGVTKIRRDELELHPAGGSSPLNWSATPNVFEAARNKGFNTAIVGWFHPYCRILTASLTDCACWALDAQHNVFGSTLGSFILNQWRTIAETEFKSPLFGQPVQTEMHVRTFTALKTRALREAANPSLGLIFLHIPAPHAPYIYNPKTGSLDLKASPPLGYFNNLQLVDRTLGELRVSLQSAGLWQSTSILLSTDHFDRSSRVIDGKADHRIPFMLKFAGETTGTVYDSPFNTILTHDLLEQILNGNVFSAETGARWIRGHSTLADSPFNR